MNVIFNFYSEFQYVAKWAIFRASVKIFIEVCLCCIHCFLVYFQAER